MGYFMGFRKSIDGKWVMLIVIFGWNRVDIYIGLIEVLDCWEKVYFVDVLVEFIDVVNGRFYILMREGKGLGKVIVIEGEKIIEVVLEGEFLFEWVVIVGDRIFVGRFVYVSYRFEVYLFNGEKFDEIVFDFFGSVYFFDFDGKKVFFCYESFMVFYRFY